MASSTSSSRSAAATIPANYSRSDCPDKRTQRKQRTQRQPMSVTRRSFIATSGAGAAALCVSNDAGGSMAVDMQARAADDRLTGVSKWDLDTPALCVDLDALERNIASMQTRLRALNVASRPHAKTHKCPAIAKRQLESGSIGICAAKLSEAEVFSANGIGPILMTTSNVSS